MSADLILTPWKINSNLLSEQMPVIDLRSQFEYEQGHLKGASHFPIASLLERLNELPNRHQELSLFGSDKQIIRATELLVQKKYPIKYQIIASDHFFQQIIDKGWLQRGNQSKRLWQPASVVKRFVKDHSTDARDQTGLDLACGAGRDSLYLAQQGWQMTAVDYSQSALDKLQQVSSRHHLKIDTQLLDLEKNFASLLAQEYRYDLILVVRYLHRPLLDKLPLLLKSGGIIVYQTFMQGCEAFGSPKNPRFLLKSGELARLYQNLHILYDQQEFLIDGRPTNAFIAQKLD